MKISRVLEINKMHYEQRNLDRVDNYEKKEKINNQDINFSEVLKNIQKKYIKAKST